MKKLLLLTLLLSSQTFATQTYYSDGTSAITEGNTTFYSNGETAIQEGNTTFYSDGTSAMSF